MPATEVMLVTAHDHSFVNQDEIQSGAECGCFYCLKTFDASEVREWVHERDGGVTALCPFCGIDSVLSANAVSLDADFLAEMQHRWFGYTARSERP